MSSPIVHVTIRPVAWLGIAAVALVFGLVFFVIGLFIAPLKTLLIALLVMFAACIAPFVWLLRLSRHL